MSRIVLLAGALVCLTALVVAPWPPYGAAQRRCVLSILAGLRAPNRLKMRATAPTEGEIDHAATLAALLAPGDDTHRFDAARAAEVEGRVVAVYVGGIETVNCLSRDPWHRDTHFDLVLPDAADTARTSRVVAEVTPRWRDAMRAAGVDWSTPALRRALLGRRVRVRGWLFFDAHHASGAAHTDPADRHGERNWRATAWEIHPVTAIDVLP